MQNEAVIADMAIADGSPIPVPDFRSILRVLRQSLKMCRWTRLLRKGRIRSRLSWTVANV